MSHSSSNRRAFLRSSSLVAAGISCPAIWSNYSEAKNEKLIFGAIGVGSRGSGDAKSAKSYATLAACADVDRRHAEKFVHDKIKDESCKIFEDYRRILDNKDYDFVTIGTPDHWHTKIAIEAMQAGKDVYCEKPLTLTIDEGKLICKVAKETGKVFQVGTQQRSEYQSKFLKAVALVQNGRIGKNLSATCSIGSGPSGGPFKTMTPPPHLNWDFWLGQAPKVDYCPERCHRTFRWWYEYSGGKMTDWGAHHIDIAQWALGYQDSGPVEVEGRGEFPSIPNGYNTATKFHITMTYPNGSTIIVSNAGNGIHFQGDRSEFFVSRRDLKGTLIDELTGHDHEWLNDQVKKLYKGKRPGSHMRNFFECMKDRSLPISDVFTHHRSMTACHLCNIAILLKRKLRWDPKQENFIGDPEASAMLKRKQRKPYQIVV